MVADMTTALILIPILAVVFVVVFRSAKRTAHLPRAPFGTDIELGPDAQRIRNELILLAQSNR